MKVTLIPGLTPVKQVLAKYSYSVCSPLPLQSQYNILGSTLNFSFVC